MSSWNRFPRSYKGMSEDRLWDELNLGKRINILKQELAELAKKDPKITVMQALEIIVEQPAYSKLEEQAALTSAVKRLQLENIMERKVTSYLPAKYFRGKDHKSKPYIPDNLY